MMTVIARDAVAADHLVYCWPFPIGPECEVTCGDDEQVVMCPAWTVGDRLGPGHHLWRTPDPMRPAGAFFVLTSAVEASFDLTTGFLLPTTGQPIRLRATGSLQVRCTDPGLLVAQFVGLPFDAVNFSVLRSVARSVERMLARLLTRRVVMAGSPLAVTDPAMLPSIIEELVAYNPTAGAVFGIEMVRVGHLAIGADDGSSPMVMVPIHEPDYSTSSGGIPLAAEALAAGGAEAHSGRARTHAESTLPPPIAEAELGASGVIVESQTSGTPTPTMMPIVPHKPTTAPGPAVPPAVARRANPLLETVRGHAPADAKSARPVAVSGSIGGDTGALAAASPPSPLAAASGELPATPPPRANPPALASASGEIVVRAKPRAEVPAARVAGSITVPHTTEEETQPLTPVKAAAREKAPKADAAARAEPRGSILGIGMGAIGQSTAGGTAVAGEIAQKVLPGGRVLVPGPNGLMQSATVRQLVQGYYELEVGSSGETIWVPINGVVPET